MTTAASERVMAFLELFGRSCGNDDRSWRSDAIERRLTHLLSGEPREECRDRDCDPLGLHIDRGFTERLPDDLLDVPPREPPVIPVGGDPINCRYGRDAREQHAARLENPPTRRHCGCWVEHQVQEVSHQQAIEALVCDLGSATKIANDR